VFMLMFASLQMAQAQVTTASMAGRVTDGRESLPGVNVRVTHIPTGSVSGTSTNLDGRFFIQGMRPGGPYRVEISMLGFGNYVREDVYLQLGQTFVLDANLREGALALEGVEIVTERGSRFTTQRTGPSTNVSSREIGLLPSMNRSITDLLRLSPYAGAGMGIAGSDGRMSNFTVDGANMNNTFGLQGGNLPGHGNPISIDAIEEVQIVVAPFDVRQTNFIGGGVNAITRSGTNQFRGTAYIFHRNQDLRGNRIGEHDLGDRPAASTTSYGFSVGGAFIPNRLFFFANVEYENEPGSIFPRGAGWGGIFRLADYEGETGPGINSRTSRENLQAVRDHLRERWGYETGGFEPGDFAGGDNALRTLFRMDWNINDRNRLTARYNFTRSMSYIGMNNASMTPVQGVIPSLGNNAVGRLSPVSWTFANSGVYAETSTLQTVALELNSRLNDRMSNQFIATFTSNDFYRTTGSDPFPSIEILGGDIDPSDRQYYIFAGFEPFSWQNGVDQTNFSLINNFTWQLDRHRITAGISYEYMFGDNSFLPMGRGVWRFASVSDFLNDAAPVGFGFSTPPNNALRPNIASTIGQLGIYAQTEWQATQRLQLTLGIRADHVHHLQEVMANNAILPLDFGGRTINTGEWPASRFNFSPRAGFVWDAAGDRSVIVRGGTGIFTGRVPLLFFGYLPGGSGMTRIEHAWAAPGFANSAHTITNDEEMLARLAGQLGRPLEEIIELMGINTNLTPEDGRFQNISGVDPNFRMPQVWKSALGVDYEIPTNFPFNVSVEGTFSNFINDIKIDNWSLRTRESDTWERWDGPDNRIRYPTIASGNRIYAGVPNEALMLVNTNKGYGYTFNVTLRAEPIRNLNLMMAFTRTELREVSGMPGSAAQATWNNVVSVNGPNLADVSRSSFTFPSQLIGFASWTTPTYLNRGFFSTSTTFGLFYRGRSATSTSFTFMQDFNGDGIARDLIWIPNTVDCLRFYNDDHRDAFWSFVNNDRYLSRNKGRHAESYAARAPWVHSFDFRLVQDLNFRAGNRTHRLQLNFDIFNVNNLFNSEWGIGYMLNPALNPVAAGAGAAVLQFLPGDQDGSNVPVFRMREDTSTASGFVEETFQRNLTSWAQLWRMQVGLRYTF